MSYRKTSDSFRSERDVLTWGDTRSPGADSRRACVFTFPPNATVKDFQRFFGLDVLEGVSVSRKAKKPTAFIQFKRPNDYTNALLRNQEKFLNSEYKITIRPYFTRDLHQKKGHERALMVESCSPPRHSRSRSRSPGLGRERIGRYRSPGGRSRSKLSRDDRSPDRYGYSYARDRTPPSRTSPDRPTQYMDNWGRILPNSGPGPFNRYDEPDLRGELPANRLENQASLPPNSHSFGSATQMTALPSTVVASHNSSLILASSSQSNQEVGYTPNYTGQKAQPLTEPPPSVDSKVPRQIDLLLNLVVETGTARTLAPGQIQDILTFFTGEKQAVELIAAYRNANNFAQNIPDGQQERAFNGFEANGDSQSKSNPADPRLRNSNDSNTTPGQGMNDVITKFLPLTGIKSEQPNSGTKTRQCHTSS